jgi:hypothetical protein
VVSQSGGVRQKYPNVLYFSVCSDGCQRTRTLSEEQLKPLADHPCVLIFIRVHFISNMSLTESKQQRLRSFPGRPL